MGFSSYLIETLSSKEYQSEVFRFSSPEYYFFDRLNNGVIYL
jgi:hypothetical protein